MRFTIFALTCSITACGGDSVLHPCDIRESSCQFDVFMAVQDVRGSTWDPWLEPPPMNVISEQQYRAQVIAAHEQALRELGVDFVTPALKLLHMIDPDEAPDAGTEFMVGSVAAYYDPRSRDVTIIDRGETGDLRLGVQTLAHELVHAAQDRDVGFPQLYARAASADGLNAVSALLEGEATIYGLLVDAKQQEIAKTAIDWRILSNWAIDLRDSISSHTNLSPYRSANTELPYPLGGLYMSAAYVEGGPLALRRVYDDPPLSAARFMAGRGNPGDAVAPAWTCGLYQAPPGLELQLADELGPLSVYAFATRFSATEPQAWERAQRWTGDRFYVYAKNNDASALVVVWLLRCADAQTAANLQAALLRAPWAQALQTALHGDTMHVLASTPGALTGAYDAWTRCDTL